MAQDKKRKNSDSALWDPKKRQKERSGGYDSPERRADAVGSGLEEESYGHHNAKNAQTSRTDQAIRTPPNGQPVAGNREQDFYLYRFLDVGIPSYMPPEKGTPGPVERFTTVSYPGGDNNLYDLDEGYTVPQELVDEYNLYYAALQQIDELEGGPCGQRRRSRSPSPEPQEVNHPPYGRRPPARPPSPESPQLGEPDYPPPGQPPLARPASPARQHSKLKFWPPQGQGKPYVLVQARPPLTQLNEGSPTGGAHSGQALDLVVDTQNRRSAKAKGKSRYIIESERGSTPDDERDGDYVPEGDSRNQRVTESGAPSDPIVDGDQTFVDSSYGDPIVVDSQTTERPATRAEATSERAEEPNAPCKEGTEVPEGWKRNGGRPPKAFIKAAAKVGDTYRAEIAGLKKTYGVSDKVAYIATGLQPRVIETRETSSWNAHQRVYKIEYPKEVDETASEYKARCLLHYLLHVKPLSKDEKTQFRENCEEFIMEYFFDNQGKELKVVSPEKRVEAAAKALQKLAQMISRGDPEIQSFGGVNYIGSDKGGRASGSSTFVSSQTVLKAIQIFNIGTKKIMLKTGDFLRAVVAQDEMELALEAPRAELPTEPLGDAGKNNASTVDPRDKTQERLGRNKDLAPVGGNSDEPPHVTVFKNSDARKRGRGYLGMTYKKVGAQRTNVDWLNLVANALSGRFRLENWFFKPYPGQVGFTIEQIPLKSWQEMGRMLCADDFHPVTGGRNEKAPRFVPWTEEEKKYKRGSKEYNSIPLVISHKGEHLLTVRHAEQLHAETNGGHSMQANDDEEEEEEAGEATSSKEHSVPKPSQAEKTSNNRAPGRPVQEATPADGASRRPLPPRAPLPLIQFDPSSKRTSGLGDSTTMSSRNLPRRGELGVAQHKKVIFSHSTPHVRVVSATNAFFSNSKSLPPSNRGLLFPQSKSQVQRTGPSQVGPSKTPGQPKHLPDAFKQDLFVQGSSRR
ncbi:hypothetical protein CVT26_004156 [Gymnopilus dilepis]|uniref:Uncharacterized protein n=1 Tax=Gymnopilus dilepis TaxID=231916 RepID=A0A409WPV0_9AGAR|nr:hypothetical protein CVT26_004156 [Gymnopilus dilepis]